jgi:hypothetical protein
MPNTLAAQPRELAETKIDVDQSSAILHFNPAQDVTAQCFYGPIHGKPDQSILTIEPTTNLEVMLTGLAPGRIYFFQTGFYDSNMVMVYFRNGAFKTPGQPILRLDSVEVVPEKYEAAIRVFVSSEMEGSVVFEGTAYPLQFTGTKEFFRPMGMTEQMLVYETSIKNAKPSKKYTYKITGKDRKGIKIVSSGEFTTLENNIALYKPVQGTFNGTFIADNFQLEGDILSRATDGKYDYTTGMAVSTDPDLEDQWLVVDLQAGFPVDEITCYWRAVAYPVEYTVSIGTNGTDWTEVKIVRADKEREVLGNMPVQVGRASFDGAMARYVKVFFPKGGQYFRRFDNYRFLQLVELKVIPKE